MNRFTSLVIYVASGPHTSPITDDDRNGRPLEIAGLCKKKKIIKIITKINI